MNITECIQISMLFLATFSTLITVATFRRNKRIELENHLYKVKLEAYTILSYELDKFFIQLNSAIYYMKNGFKLQSKYDWDRAKKHIDELDPIVMHCNSLVIKYSAYFPKDVINEFKKFSENLFKDLGDEIQEEFSENINRLDTYYNEQLNYANNAIDFARINLNLEKMNYTLYKRLR